MRSAAIAVLAALAGLLAAAPGAHAITDCGQLQESVDLAASGDTVHVDHVYLNCSITVANKSLIFQGGAGGVGGFQGGHPIISVGSNGGASFRDLTFKSGLGNSDGGAIHAFGAASVGILRSHFSGNSGADGGAVYANTSAMGPVTIRDSSFDGNSATGGGGGAYVAVNNGPVTVERTTFTGNGASIGGGLVVEGPRATLRDLDVSGNTAAYDGGGAAIFAGPSVELTRSRFVANKVTTPAASTAQRTGGGLKVVAQGTVTQTGNSFRDNSVTYNRPTADAFPSGGGGEFASGNLVSRDDVFTRNSVRNLASGGEPAEGGGLFVFGCVSVANPPRTTAHGENLVAAGNTLTGGDEGAGVYVGCGKNPVDFTLLDSTIAGNHGGSPLDGGAKDTLKLVNSVVTGAGKALGVTGFASRAAAFSDVCRSGGQPLTGPGNLCADARLRDSGHGDAHETGRSPTRDRGSNARVPSGLTRDFEGGARITDAQPDARAIVDMGADETPTGKLVLGSVRLSLARFRAKNGRHGGTTIAFTISGPTPVRFSVASVPRHGAPKRAGAFIHTARAGRNHVRFTGRIGRTKLKPGRYRLTLKGKNRLNNRSNTVSVLFTIVR